MKMFMRYDCVKMMIKCIAALLGNKMRIVGITEFNSIENSVNFYNKCAAVS